MYNTLCWNARGVGNRSTSTHLKQLCSDHKIDIAVIIEPKIQAAKLESLSRYWGFENYLHGSDTNNHIWICWTDNILLEDPTWTNQQVTVNVSHINFQSKICMSFVHASCVLNDRQVLWNYLTEKYGDMETPWLLLGDFNAILSWDEKQGGNRDDPNSMMAFNNFVNRNALIDAGFVGNEFTWCNNQNGSNRIWERLDRAILNPSALATYPRLMVTHLDKIHSDHRPIVMALGGHQRNQSLFAFQKGWVTHPSFHDFVSRT